MVWKLLKRHLSIVQFVGFFLANLLGMFIVLLSIQFYQDVKPLFSQEDGLMKKEYMILSKRVSTLGSLVKKSSGFTSEDVDEIKNQPFVKNVGAFTPGHFICGSLDGRRHGDEYTDVFRVSSRCLY